MPRETRAATSVIRAGRWRRPPGKGQRSSINTSRATRPARAPSAARRANSPRRACIVTRSRWPTLAHAIANTTIMAAVSIHSTDPVESMMPSRNGTTAMRRRSCVFGNSFASSAERRSKSACAISRVDEVVIRPITPCQVPPRYRASLAGGGASGSHRSASSSGNGTVVGGSAPTTCGTACPSSSAV